MNSDTYLVVGLGNPGPKYKHTRHNVGWEVLEKLMAQFSFDAFSPHQQSKAHIAFGQIDYNDVALVKPQTFMNKSGLAVQPLVSNRPDVSQLVVVHDDIDLGFGEVRVSEGSGAAGHNGVRSVIRSLGTKQFKRVRIGVAPVNKEGEMQKPARAEVRDFVLETFTPAEREKLQSDVIPQAVEKITTFIKEKREQERRG